MGTARGACWVDNLFLVLSHDGWCVTYLVEEVPHVEHFLSRQCRHNLSQTLQRLLLVVENCEVKPPEDKNTPAVRHRIII